MPELLAPPSPGIHRDVPIAHYLAWDAFGSSDLKAMRSGPPAMVPWRRAHPEAASDSMRVGAAAHCAILEPGRFDRSFRHKPEGLSFSTKEGKAWRSDVPDGVAILTHHEWEMVASIACAFRSKAIAQAALDRATATEASLAWRDPDTGLGLKARPDFYIKGEYVYEIKVTRFASEQAIAFRSFTEGWLWQLAHYYAGLAEVGERVSGARIIAINPEPPHEFRIWCVEVKQDALSLMHLDNERVIARLAKCHSDNSWPGASDSWDLIDLPPLAMSQMEQVQWDEDHKIGASA